MIVIDHNDLYNVFDSEQFDYYYPITWEKRNKEYLEMSEKSSATWNYQDTVRFSINLRECNEDIVNNDFLDNSDIVVTFYNFRYESIYSQTYSTNDLDSEEYTIILDIDRETSSNIFTKGIYRMGIIVKSQEENGDFTTVLSSEDFLIYVN